MWRLPECLNGLGRSGRWGGSLSPGSLCLELSPPGSWPAPSLLLGVSGLPHGHGHLPELAVLTAWPHFTEGDAKCLAQVHLVRE